MSRRSRTIIPVIMVLLFTGIQGCGLKPAPGIPAGITTEQVMTVIENRMERLNDFSGRAQAKATVRGQTESAVITINYMKPDRFRATIKGTFGIVLAVITAEQDSFHVYIPSIKGYFIVGRDENVLDLLVPEVEFDFNLLASLFTGSFPASDVLTDSHIALSRMQNQALLTIENGAEVYRYTVTGPDLLVMEEVLIRNGKNIWRITYSDYASSGDTMFPRKIIISEGDKELQLSFSKFKVNPGLTERDLSFKIPSNAERYFIEKTQVP